MREAKAIKLGWALAVVLAAGAAAVFFARSVFSSVPRVGHAIHQAVGMNRLNGVVLDVLDEYRYKKYGAVSNKDMHTAMGVTEDIRYRGKLVAKARADRQSHCSGITFEIYMKACKEYAGSADFVLPKVSAANVAEFRREWYGTDGNERTLVRALVGRGLAEEVADVREAKAGDFMQFWRHGGTGHSVVFLEWIFSEEGKIRGIKYWSSQPETNGPGENTEYIGGGAWDIDPKRIFLARALKP